MDAVQANVLGAAAPTLSIKGLGSPSSGSGAPQASAIPPPGVLPPVVLQPPHLATSVTSTASAASADTQNSHVSTEELVKQKQEELQKKLMEEGEPTLQQQESMSIKGQNVRKNCFDHQHSII